MKIEEFLEVISTKILMDGPSSCGPVEILILNKQLVFSETKNRPPGAELFYLLNPMNMRKGLNAKEWNFITNKIEAKIKKGEL